MIRENCFGKGNLLYKFLRNAGFCLTARIGGDGVPFGPDRRHMTEESRPREFKAASCTTSISRSRVGRDTQAAAQFPISIYKIHNPSQGVASPTVVFPLQLAVINKISYMHSQRAISWVVLDLDKFS